MKKCSYHALMFVVIIIITAIVVKSRDCGKGRWGGIVCDTLYASRHLDNVDLVTCLISFSILVEY